MKNTFKKSDLEDFIIEHETAYEDFKTYFGKEPNKVSVEDTMAWVEEHDTLYNDLITRFKGETARNNTNDEDKLFDDMVKLFKDEKAIERE